MASLACSRLVKRLVGSFSFLINPRARCSFQRVSLDLRVRRIHTEPSDFRQPISLQLPEDSFRAHNCEKPSLDVQVTKDDLLNMYREMQTIRRMELEADALYKIDLVRGYCHLAIGQVSWLVIGSLPILQLLSFRKQSRSVLNMVWIRTIVS